MALDTERNREDEPLSRTEQHFQLAAGGGERVRSEGETPLIVAICQAQPACYVIISRMITPLWGRPHQSDRELVTHSQSVAYRSLRNAIEKFLFTHFLGPSIIYYLSSPFALARSPTLPTSVVVVIVQMTEANVLVFLRSAVGSSSYRKLPVPKHWDTMNRPHVALLDSVDERVFCFFLSQPSVQGNGLTVVDLKDAPTGTVVEIRRNALDYRYYRRESEAWRLVAEVRSQFLMEVYDRGDGPVVVPLPEGHVLASE